MQSMEYSRSSSKSTKYGSIKYCFFSILSSTFLISIEAEDTNETKNERNANNDQPLSRTEISIYVAAILVTSFLLGNIVYFIRKRSRSQGDLFEKDGNGPSENLDEMELNQNGSEKEGIGMVGRSISIEPGNNTENASFNSSRRYNMAEIHKELKESIRKGDWNVAASTAAVLSNKYEFSASTLSSIASFNSISTTTYSNLNSSWRSNSALSLSDIKTDYSLKEKVTELDNLVYNEDWDGVIVMASNFAAADKILDQKLEIVPSSIAKNLDGAVQNNDWAEVGRIAALLSLSTQSLKFRDDSWRTSARSIDAFEEDGGNEIANEIDRLVAEDDWEGVILIASKIGAANSTKEESVSYDSTVPLERPKTTSNLPAVTE